MFLVLGFGDGETFDVVAAPRKQPDHPREHAGLVLHQHREGMGLGRVMAIFHEVGGCGLVHLNSSFFFVMPARPSYPRKRVSSKRRHMMKSRAPGVLDRPVRPDDDGGICGSAFILTPALSFRRG